MEWGVVTASSDLEGFKEALQAHLREQVRDLLAPTLFAAVATLIEGGNDGDAASKLACIKYTLENGACIDARKEEGGETVLIIAAKAGRLDVIIVMMEHWNSVENGGVGRGGGPDVINAVGGFGNTALILAALKGHAKIVTALIGATSKAGVAIDLNMVNEEGNTALIMAAYYGHAAVVTALVGATGKDGVAVDPNVVNAHGVTALIGAAGNGHTGVLTALLGASSKYGVAIDLNVVSKIGNTALLRATENGHAEIVTALLDAKEHNPQIVTAVDVALKDKDGHTAHHYASTTHAAKFTPEILARLDPIPQCPKPEATVFLESLGIHDIYFNPTFDRCYCRRCYKGPATISNEGPTRYVVPEPGWVRFGLLPVGGEARAHALEVFNKWCACFHGVKSSLVLKSILDHGGLMKPGSKLIDGPMLESTKCAGRQDEIVYTSPTIKYAGLKFYAEPIKFTTAAGVEMRGSIALQCRQNPTTIEKQGETMSFKKKMPGHLEKHCPNVNLAEIEWKTDSERAVIPYGLLVRVWQKANDPDAEAYSSPIDNESKWWVKEDVQQKADAAVEAAAQRLLLKNQVAGLQRGVEIHDRAAQVAVEEGGGCTREARIGP